LSRTISASFLSASAQDRFLPDIKEADPERIPYTPVYPEPGQIAESVKTDDSRDNHLFGSFA
jgi:hypothetical protein